MFKIQWKVIKGLSHYVEAKLNELEEKYHIDIYPPTISTNNNIIVIIKIKGSKKEVANIKRNK